MLIKMHEGDVSGGAGVTSPHDMLLVALTEWADKTLSE